MFALLCLEFSFATTTNILEPFLNSHSGSLEPVCNLDISLRRFAEPQLYCLRKSVSILVRISLACPLTFEAIAICVPG